MSTATVRQISNGFIIASAGSVSVPSNLYAATVAEVPYWLNKVLDPALSTTTTNPMPPSTGTTTAQAQISNFSSGGFLVVENRSGGVIETYCASMDAVADLLTVIFTPVTPPAG